MRWSRCVPTGPTPADWSASSTRSPTHTSAPPSSTCSSRRRGPRSLPRDPRRDEPRPVEYYFSDFLSALESDEPIELMASGVEEELLALGHDELPAQLKIPPNVSFLGTVNVDETTQSFSPKVLDRANVIEFSDVDIERALGHPVDDPTEGLRLKDGQLNPAGYARPRSRPSRAPPRPENDKLHGGPRGRPRPPYALSPALWLPRHRRGERVRWARACRSRRRHRVDSSSRL